MTRLDSPFMAEAKMRQEEHGGTAPGKPKTLLPNLVKLIDPIDTAAILAEKGGISKGTMQPAKMRQEETLAKPGEQAHRRALPNLVKPIDTLADGTKSGLIANFGFTY